MTETPDSHHNPTPIHHPQVKGTSKVWTEILAFLHPGVGAAKREWGHALIAEIVSVAHMYNMVAVLDECAARACRMGYSSDTRDDNYALKWLGYAEQYQVSDRLYEV